MQILTYFLITINIVLLTYYILFDNKISNDEVPIYANVNTIELLGEKSTIEVAKPKYIKPVPLPVVSKKQPQTLKKENNTTQQPLQDENKTKKDAGFLFSTTKKEQCWSIGPFKNKKNIILYKNKISNQTIKTKIRSASSKTGGSYRVYLTAKNRKEAHSIVANLRAKRIKDMYVMKNGTNANYISLGLFGVYDNAVKKANIIKKAGYNAIVDTTYRNVNTYWLDYKAMERADTHDTLIFKHLKIKCNF
jgi:hypothetical protein